MMSKEEKLTKESDGYGGIGCQNDEKKERKKERKKESKI